MNKSDVKFENTPHMTRLEARQEIKLAWIHLADNYKSIGQRERAYEVLKEMAELSGQEVPNDVFQALFQESQLEWEIFYRWYSSSIAEAHARFQL